jgi:phosphoglycolate phosphatase
MIRLVLFDIDGTLIHTNAAGVVAFGEVFREDFGFPGATEGVRFAGGTDTGLARGIFRSRGHEPSEADFTRFFSNYTTRLTRLLTELGGGVFDGVDPFMDGLKALPEPPTIGLLTGNIRRGAEIKLGHFGLWDRFVMGGFGDDHEERDEIAKIAHRRGVELLKRELKGEEILVIGDTPLDVRCGRAIGAKVLAVATGMYSVAELEETKPDWAVGSLKELDVSGIVG